ncbi:MAG: hypothetical protein B6I24_10000 [Bacteroidetes bacterium 4572_128]|nr:MAG: hypothetical protein B6I24_10000 [Bacteroidetes bacterium 4572_128]
MKNLKFLIFLGIFVFVFISCEKDDDNEEVKKSTLEACIEMTTVESNVGESRILEIMKLLQKKILVMFIQVQEILHSH